MEKPEDNENLSELRRGIDAIDDGIIKLLIERIGIVGKVGALKRDTGGPACPIRPGREADMLRRIIAQFAGSGFSPAAAAAIWRVIIGSSTATEADLTISVLSDGKDNTLYWLAREYFGPSVPIIRQPHVKRVMGDVMDGKAAVGMVPFVHSDENNHWWTNLMERGDHIPKIFAQVPFVHTDTPVRDTPCGYAIARIVPEASGDDMSLVVIEAEHNVSQSRLQAAFAAEKIEARWINIAMLNPATRLHLIEIRTFVPAEPQGWKNFLASLGNSIQKIDLLGCYATPLILNKNSDVRPVLHAAGNK